MARRVRARIKGGAKAASRALVAFLREQSAGGLILMGCAGVALVIANSPAAGAYQALLHAPLFGLDLLHWINDGLMAVFFLLVGLEIKREFADGELSDWPSRVLPGVAAVGGMLAPALVYLAFNLDDPARTRGWAVPAATDIAFALGVLALLGSRVPTSLKVFLTALAVLDDLGAIVVIALFYTADLTLWALAAAAGALAILLAMNRLRVAALWPYLAVGAALWAFTLKSGVHATLAGVLLALTIPLRPHTDEGDDPASPLHRLEHAISPWVAFAIVPIFALANAGVSLEGVGADQLAAPLPLGVALGLLVGKQIGVFLPALLVIRLGWAARPADASLVQLYGVSLLCGVGFTMSLFIGSLAFPSEAMQAEAKLGVIAGSLAAGLAGYLVLRLAGRPTVVRA